MADPKVEEVLSLVTSDAHLQRLAGLLCGLNEKQRRALSGPVAKHAEAVWLDHGNQNAPALAVLGCVTGVRQVAARLEWLELSPEGEELAGEVLRARQPHWLSSLPEALLAGKDRRPQGFRLVRALVRAGLVDRPELPEYVLLMVRGLEQGHGWGEGPTVLDHLRADPGLLERELWDLFRTEGAGRALAGHDSWLRKPYEQPYGDRPTIPARPERTWHHAVVALAEEGVIDRQRLLSDTLATFLRDWTASDVGWFVRLQDALAPTVEEMAERQATYARLLVVAPGPPVALALRSLTALLADGRLDLELLLSGAPAVLARGDKGPVVSMLRLIADVAKAQPAAGERLAPVLAEALRHENIEVQERALFLLTKLVPDAERRDGLRSANGDEPATAFRGATAPAPTFGPASAPPPPPASPPLERVGDADELADLFVHLVEEADDPAEVERLLEGVCRLAQQRPRRSADALRRRLHDLAEAYYPGAWTGEELRADLVALGRIWLGKTPPGQGYEGREYGMDYKPARSIVLRRPDWSLTALLTMRVHEAAIAVARGGATLLSFPTNRSGVLSAAALNERVVALGRLGKPLALDAGLAVMRVAPSERDVLVLPVRHRTGRLMTDQVERLRRYRPDWELIVGRSPGRYRDDEYERAVTWRDRASPRGAVDDLVPALLDRRDPLRNLALEAADGEYAGRFDQVTAMWPLMLPHNPDLLAAHAHARLNRGLQKNRAATEPLVDAIGRASTPLGPPAASALVLALAAKNGVERARAVDAIVDSSERFTLSGGLLGTQLAALLQADVVVGSRIVPGLAEAAKVGPAAASMVADCLVEALPALPGRRDAHSFVDLLARLAVEQKRTVRLPTAFVDAARSRAGSMLARACQRVPQDPG